MIKKTVILIGGSSDIGIALIEKLASEGYNIIATYNNTMLPAHILDYCQKHNCELTAYKLNVCDSSEVVDFFNNIVYKNSLIESMVYCAGVSKKEKLLMDESFENIDEILSVNLKGAIITSKLMMKALSKIKRGSIVYVSSIYGLYGGSCESVYSATKGGINALTKALSLEMASFNVRVNAVAPGCIKTKMIERFSDDELEDVAHYIPLKRLGDGSDVANAVSFLLSDDASYITGEILTVSGGALRF